jgi:hypothetical protein
LPEVAGLLQRLSEKEPRYRPAPALLAEAGLS